MIRGGDYTHDKIFQSIVKYFLTNEVRIVMTGAVDPE